MEAEHVVEAHRLVHVDRQQWSIRACRSPPPTPAPQRPTKASPEKPADSSEASWTRPEMPLQGVRATERLSIEVGTSNFPPAPGGQPPRRRLTKPYLSCPR
jgi:hypothetical protein